MSGLHFRNLKDRREVASTLTFGGALAIYSNPECSSVAQLAEHPAVNRRVVGSSPTWGANLLNKLHSPPVS